MRRFKIGSANRFFLLGAIALGAQLGLGGSQAMAQIYDFTFDSSLGAGSIDFILSGTQVTGAVAGSGTGILSNGTLSTSNNENGYGTMPTLISTRNAPFFATNAQNIVFIDNSSNQFLLAADGIPDQDFVDEYTLGSGGQYIGGSFLSNESLTERTPAPVPGSGLLSYLVLGLGGLFFYRERLWRAARMAIGVAV